MGRIVGETAALIYTAGTVTECARFADEPPDAPWRCTCMRCSTEGLYTNEAYATAVVLLVLVFIINAAFRAYVAQTKLRTR